MKPMPKVVFSACLVFLTLHHVVATDVHFYVSPTGTDSHNEGRDVTKPARTIRHAVAVASSAKYKNVTKIIELMAGYHDQTGTIAISLQDAIIRSYQKQEVHVTGGRRVPSSAFKHVTDQNILSKLSPAARKHVRVVHLPDVNITNYGNMSTFGASSHRTAALEVSFNGKAMKLARWPNEGFIDITATPDGVTGKTFQYNSTVPKSWLHESDPWIHGFLHYTWFDEGLPVSDLNTNTMTVTLGQTSLRGIVTGQWNNPHNKGSSRGGFFRFINILSALDEAGEYYLDKAHGNLYIWVANTDGNVGSNDVIYTSMLNSVIVIRGNARNVTLQDFTVESSRKYGISGDHIKEIQLVNLEVKNTGSSAIRHVGDTRNLRIAQCLIHDSDGGIELSGGNRKLLETSGNIIEDNEIYDFSRASFDAMEGINVGGEGHLIRNNHIHTSRSRAIGLQGNDIIVENNIIHDVCLERYSCAGIITFHDYTARGNVVRSNIIHDIKGLEIPDTNCLAVKLETHSSGYTITNNVFYNNDIHVYIDGGRNNIVTDNIMYNATVYSIVANKRTGNRNEQQIMLNLLHNMPYHNEEWTLRYPELANIDTTNYSLPEGNYLTGNIVYIEGKAQYVHVGQTSVNSPEYFNVSNTGYSIGPDDHFNVGNGDYRVKCTAAEWANKNDFQQVPSPNDVGPRKAPVGPTYLKHGRIQLVNLVASSSVCTTKAPARTPPVSAYLPDGSDTHKLFNVSNEGCWLVVTKCTSHAEHNGTFRDMYGERFKHAGDSEEKCFSRAVDEWKACGGHTQEPVAAIYGPTGATTYAGDGCFIAQYGCPNHGGPANGHVISTGKIVRDVLAESNYSAKTNETGCLSHALEYWKYCGSSPNHPITTIYRPTGAIRTAGAGCWIHTDQCPSHPEYKSMFYDAWGSTNRHTDAIEHACLDQAEYYWHLCGSDTKSPVTAYYRPTTASNTFP